MVNAWGERLGGLCAILFGLYFLQIGYHFPVGGHIFPVFTTVSIIGLGALMILRSFLFRATFVHDIRPEIAWGSLKPIIFTALSVGYFLLTFRLGYFAATFLFLLVTPYLLGLRQHLGIIAAAVLANGFIYFVFQWMLNARLPRGILM